MNFQELMNKASENSINALKQKKKPGHLHKDSTPNVSSSAVQSFLIKKQQEAKKRQADEEVARRARIKARIEQNHQNKRGTKRPNPDKNTAFESSSSNPPQDDDQQKPSKIPKKEKQKSHGNDKMTKTKSTAHSSTINSTSNLERERTKFSKHSDKARELKKDKTASASSKVAEKEKTSGTSKSKKVKSRPAPPDFKQILAIAEKNKLGLRNTNEKPKQNKPKHEDLSTKETQITKDRYKKDNQKLARKEEKSIPKEKIKEHKKQPQTKDSGAIKSKLHAAKQQTSSQPVDKKRTQSHRDIVSDKPPRPGTNHRVPYRPPSRSYQQRQHLDYYEEEEDDLDGFIDDEEVNSGVGGDISAHIRDIFGYDRRRFQDRNDFDDGAMESSYSQIEKEENRSSKIAKLEDEIAFLKEQADLKKERENLLNNRKKSKKI